MKFSVPKVFLFTFFSLCFSCPLWAGNNLSNTVHQKELSYEEEFPFEDFDSSDESEASSGEGLPVSGSSDDSDAAGEESGSTDEMEDFDSLFEDAQDSEKTESEPVANVIKFFGDNITFWGNFNAKLAYLQGVYPTVKEHYPAASFSSYIGITIKPYKDLSLQACFQTIFPSMGISVYTYYLNYDILGYAYLTLGRTRKSWGNATIFDTNILDDKATDDYPDASIFLDASASSSKPTSYDLIFTVPVKKGQFEAIASYEAFSEVALSPDNFEGEVMFEYPIGKFNLGVFAKYWNRVATTHKNPALGFEFTGEVFDIRLTGWASVNVDWSERLVTYARSVVGISRAWLDNPRMGLTCEYEFIYNHQQSDVMDFMHYVGFKYAWSHAGGSIVSPSLQWFLGVNEKCGVVAPSLTLSILPHAKLTLTMPIFYGDQSVEYGGATISSTAEKPVIFCAALLSLSGDF